MKAYIRNWYYIGGIIFAVLAFALGIFGDQIDPMRKIMMVLYMSLLLHQYEEYAVPGGFPAAWNYGVSGEKEVYDRYPLNAKSAFIVNICCAYPAYILGIIFSSFLPLCLFVTYFTMPQILMHGILMNKKMGTFYNPGVATALFVMLPAGIYSLWFIGTHYNFPGWYWWVPLLFQPVAALCMIGLPIKLCQDKKTPYNFPSRDINGFSIQNHVARIRR